MAKDDPPPDTAAKKPPQETRASGKDTFISIHGSTKKSAPPAKPQPKPPATKK